MVIRHPVPFFKLAVESEIISNSYFSYFQWTIFFTFNPIQIIHYFLWKIFWTRIHDSKVRALAWLVRRKSTKFYTKSYFLDFRKSHPNLKFNDSSIFLAHFLQLVSERFYSTKFLFLYPLDFIQLKVPFLRHSLKVTKCFIIDPLVRNTKWTFSW